MLSSVIQFLTGDCVQQAHQRGQRICRPVRIGGVPLRADCAEIGGHRSTPSDFDHVAKGLRAGRLSHQAMGYGLIVVAHPVEDGDGAVFGVSFFVTCDQKGDAAGSACFTVVDGRCDESRDAGFHVHCAASPKLIVSNGSGERRMRPLRRVTLWHDICVAAKAK